MIQAKSDQELLEAVRATRDEGAFTELVRRYRPVVARTVHAMLGTRAAADEVGQDVFIRFYRKIEQFKGEAQLGTYLNRIAINLCLNFLKQQQRRRKYFVPDASWAVEDEPRTESEYREEKQLLEYALQQLAPKFRAVLVLRHLQGYSTQETAALLDLPKGTVLSRLSRGQDKLRTILIQLGENT